MPVKRTQIRGIKDAKKSNKFANGGDFRKKVEDYYYEQLRPYVAKKVKDSHDKYREIKKDDNGAFVVRQKSGTGPKRLQYKENFLDRMKNGYGRSTTEEWMDLQDRKAGLKSYPNRKDTRIGTNRDINDVMYGKSSYKKGGKLKTAGKKFKCGGKLGKKC